MTFREIVWFEIGCQLRRPSTWAYGAALFALSIYPSLELAAEYARIDGSSATSPFLVSVLSLLWSTVGMIVASALAGDAAARDAQTRMDSLVYTAPVTKAAYLAGRFCGAFLVYAVLVMAVPIGLALGAPLLIRAELGGPFQPATYLAAYLLLLLPNGFVAIALMFSLAALTRRAVSSYLGGVLLAGVSAFGWVVLAQSWGRWELAKLLDPFAATILGELSMAWTPAERTSRSIELNGALLWNRLLWLAVAAGMLALTYRCFAFAHHATRNARRRPICPDPPRPGDQEVRRLVPDAAERSLGFTTHVRQMCAVAFEVWRALTMGWAGVILVAAAAFLVFSATPSPHLGVPLVPTAERIIGSFGVQLTRPAEINWIVVPLLIVFWAGELIWRERDIRLNDVTDVVPVPGWTQFLGRAAGLGLVLVTMQALVMTGGIATQLAFGYRDIEIAPYLQALFGLQLADYLLFALLTLSIHTLVDHKYLGHLAGLLAYAFMAHASALGIEHHLLVYGGDPGWSYSDLRRFEPFVGPWLWFKLYWTAWAVLLAAVAILFRVRGPERHLRARLVLARRRLTPGMRGAAAVTVAALLSLGGFIFYNTNVLNAYTPSADVRGRRAEYERRYGPYRSEPQPQLTRTSLRVEIDPHQRKVDIHGTLQLVNTTSADIGRIHLQTKSAVQTTGVHFDRLSRELVVDDRLGHRVYGLEPVLRPGETVRLEFDVRFGPRGFSNDGHDASVAANGTYFTNAGWLPEIGYEPDRELVDAAARRAHGLPPRPMTPPVDDLEARHDPDRTTRTAFDAVVGTAAGQTAVAPGRLLRAWTENGRRYFHYATDAPIRNDYAFYSAAYAVREARWRPSSGTAPEVSIEIYHHPEHGWNIDRMIRSVQASLDDFTKRLGPYRHGQVRLIEHAGDSVTLHAAPVNISYQEPFALLSPDRDTRQIDLPYAVVAHEVAHQWWGGELTPAGVEGAGLLTETLAWYSALGVVEHSLGPEHLQRFLGFMREAYLRPTSRANVPLLRADDQFLAYRKGPLAMYAVREYLGAREVDGALRRLLEQHGSARPPLPTPLDLYRELRAIAPAPLHDLLADLFERNTFWELAAGQVKAEPAPDGGWYVTLDVDARKVVVGENGVETEVPMNDLVEIGVFGDAVARAAGDVLYLNRHPVRSGRQRITVTVPKRPASAGIDPRRLLIDFKGDDNVKAVAPGIAGPARHVRR